MKKHGFVAAVLITAMLAVTVPRPAWANSQTIALGIGVGKYEYDETDTQRSAAPLKGMYEELMRGVQSQMYLEWYALGSLGFGVRGLNVGSDQSGGTAGSPNTRVVSVRSKLVTVNWVPLGGERYARLGMLAGVGRSNYEVATTSGGTTGSEATSGGARLLGAYLDWGADGFGARFGVNALKTRLEDLNTLHVDGSGQGYYLDLRWAWP